MTTPRQEFDSGTTWTDDRTREVLPLLLALATRGRTWTYGDLNHELVRREFIPPRDSARGYGPVLFKIGRLLNDLADVWQRELPPLTVLITSASTGMPNTGVDEFLERFLADNGGGSLTPENHTSVINRATSAVYDFDEWDRVGEYFGAAVPTDRMEAQSIDLPKPEPIRGGGGESQAHKDLKHYIAGNPQLLIDFGRFVEHGQIEFMVDSGDEIDVLFTNETQVLIVEVKTKEAKPGELTRGLFQCVKYRAILGAMYELSHTRKRIEVVLITPQPVPTKHRKAANKLGIRWLQVEMPKS